MAWLVVSGIRVFTSPIEGRFGPWHMHRIYVVVQIVVGLAYTGLAVANDLDIAGRLPDTVWVHDAIVSLLVTTVHPALLIPILWFRRTVFRSA